MEKYNKKMLMQKFDLSESSKKVKILLATILFFVIYAMSRVYVYYTDLTAFGISTAFAFWGIGFNGILIGIEFLVANTLSAWSIKGLIIGLYVCLTLIILQMVSSKHKSIASTKWRVILFALIADIGYIVCNFGSPRENLASLISIALSSIFLYFSLEIFALVISGRAFRKVRIDDKIFMSIMLFVFSLGLSNINIGPFRFIFIFFATIVLLSISIFDLSITTLISAILGLGASIYSSNNVYMSMFVTLGLFAGLFKGVNKIFSSISILLGYVIFSILLCGGISYFELISLLLGTVIFIMIPTRYIDFVISKISGKGGIITSSVIDDTLYGAKRKIKNLSKVFLEMKNTYKNMMRGTLPVGETVALIKSKILEEYCTNCPNCDECHRKDNGFLDSSIDMIVATAYTKGKVVLVDLPQYFTSVCCRVGGFVSTVNGIIDSYKQYESSVESLDTGKVLVSSQMGAVSTLLGNVASNMVCERACSVNLRDTVIRVLDSSGIDIVECMIWDSDIAIKNIYLVIFDYDNNDKALVKIMSKLMGKAVDIDSKQSGEVAGQTIIKMSTSPNYDIAFGCSAKFKNGRSITGDSKSVIKLDKGKYLLSICDGMGSGESAHNISKLTIELIENFYRAGFENDLILGTINDLLTLSECENFSTIDLCIIDGFRNSYDFIKLGAVNGFVVGVQGNVDEIVGSGLPVGMVEDLRPHTIKRMIENMDIVILVSDGVFDAFEGNMDIRSFIKSLDLTNPQTIADTVLSKAIEYYGGVSRDDMTVLVAKVFNCN